MGSCISSTNKQHTHSGTHLPAVDPASRSARWKKKIGLYDGRVISGPLGGEPDEAHQRVSGRVFFNGSTQSACLFTQQGKKGTNQDAMIVWENFTLRSDTIFCGVFDGHGPYGHLVARKVRDSLPLKLCTEWKASASGEDSPHHNGNVSGSMNSEEMASINIDDDLCEPTDVDENVKLPEMYPMLKQSLLKAFKLMDKELKLHPAIDCFCSGSTAVTVVKQGQDLVIGNVGDSRAILGTRDNDNNLVAVQLTVDLKPNLPREAARIQRCKGRVFALQDEPEVARVWLPNSDSPGLAMARAFGDFCLKDYGLISVPDISYRRLTDKDEFMVLASDGVWDVFSNKEVVDIVSSAPTRDTAARALVECAVRAWRLKFPTSKSDDCAVICLFFDNPSSSSPPVPSTKEDEQEQETVREPIQDKHVTSYSHNNTNEIDEIVDDVNEISEIVENPPEKLPGKSQSTRSLAEFISTSEEEEWTALEGVTRVNSLLNVPRFLTGDKKSASRKKRS